MCTSQEVTFLRLAPCAVVTFGPTCRLGCACPSWPFAPWRCLPSLQVTSERGLVGKSKLCADPYVWSVCAASVPGEPAGADRELDAHAAPSDEEWAADELNLVQLSKRTRLSLFLFFCSPAVCLRFALQHGADQRAASASARAHALTSAGARSQALPRGDRSAAPHPPDRRRDLRTGAAPIDAPTRSVCVRVQRQQKRGSSCLWAFKSK